MLAHPECPPEVIDVCDFTGSTAAMNDYVVRRKPRQVVLITECSMADNVAADAPDTEFVRPCNLCPYMKRITLEAIRDALLYDRYEVTVDEADRRTRERWPCSAWSTCRRLRFPPATTWSRLATTSRWS